MLAGNNSQIDSAQAQILVSDYQEEKANKKWLKYQQKNKTNLLHFLANNAKKRWRFCTSIRATV